MAYRVVAMTQQMAVLIHVCGRRLVRTSPVAVDHTHRALDHWYTFSPHQRCRLLPHGTVAVNAADSTIFPCLAHGHDQTWVAACIGVAVADQRG